MIVFADISALRLIDCKKIRQAIAKHLQGKSKIDLMGLVS
jgi:hypothetical protein